MIAKVLFQESDNMRNFLVLSLLMVVLSGSNLENFFDSMKKKQAQYQDKNTSNNMRDSLVKRFNIPSEENVTKEYSKTINSLNEKSKKAINESIPWITKKMLSGVSEEQLQSVVDAITQKATTNEKIDTIFYLFSTSQTEYSLYNFISAVSKLESLNKNIKYYGVVQGMLNKTELDMLYKPFKFEKELGAKTIIKMHPLMYRDLELKRVPAYLFSKCSAGEFKYKNCENKYLVRGDISLHKALEIVSVEDSSYLDYLHLLEKGDY